MNDLKGSIKWLPGLVLGLVCIACSPGSNQADTPAEGEQATRLLIIGQDLGAIRGYYESACCIQPDGNTAYVNLYNVLSEQEQFSGLGIDNEGKKLETEADFGTGPLNMYKTATEFSGGLAIGLELAENRHPDALNLLIAGEYDEHIAQLAHFLKMVEVPVWLRIGYEFDGAWNRGYEDSEKYKTAYRRVVEKLRLANVANVEYVWQSGTSPVDDVIDGGHEDISKWYPGDEYVDWMGMSLFLSLDEKPVAEMEFEPPTQRDLMEEVLAFARARGKPVMIAEASPQGYDLANRSNANIAPIWDGKQKGDLKIISDQEIWENWFAPLFQYMNENDDVIRALAYINANWDAQPRWGKPHAEGYWGDSRLEANSEIAGRFNRAITQWRDR